MLSLELSLDTYQHLHRILLLHFACWSDVQGVDWCCGCTLEVTKSREPKLFRTHTKSKQNDTNERCQVRESRPPDWSNSQQTWPHSVGQAWTGIKTSMYASRDHKRPARFKYFSYRASPGGAIRTFYGTQSNRSKKSPALLNYLSKTNTIKIN